MNTNILIYQFLPTYTSKVWWFGRIFFLAFFFFSFNPKMPSGILAFLFALCQLSNQDTRYSLKYPDLLPKGISLLLGHSLPPKKEKG